MMDKYNTKIWLILIFLQMLSVFFSEVISQSIESIPKVYFNPVYFNEIHLDDSFESDVQGKPRKKHHVDWFVISDKNNNYTYSSRNIESDIKAKLSFRDIAYVTEDHNGWLRIAKRNGDSIQDLGWIPKQHVLQWRNSLLDAQTGINLKGFILNRLETLQLQKLEFAELFDSPDGNNLIGKLPLHDFYFVFKIHRDAQGNATRYLLGSDNVLSSRKTDYLKGWVDVEKITNWNTRLSLEPNFTEEGFEERVQNEKFHVKGFYTKRQAEKISSGNFAVVNDRAIWWDGDPVKTNKGVAEGTHRLKGDQIRFPILQNNENSYSSGVLASMPDQSRNIIDSPTIIDVDPIVLQEIEDRTKSINLVYVIEGCEKFMADYNRVIKNISSQLLREGQYTQVTVTLGVYKDILESDESEYVKTLPATTDMSKVSQFLDTNFWGRSGDFEEMTCWHYGLYKTLKAANLSSNATNVVIQLGNYDDFSIDEDRVENSAKKYSVDKSILRKLFSDYDINWLVANVKNDDSYFSDSFDTNIRLHINDMTKEIYTEYASQLEDQLEGIKIPTPRTPKLSTGLLISTKDFITTNRFLRCPPNSQITAKQLAEFLSESLGMIKNYNNRMLSSVTGGQINLDGDNMAFTSNVIGVLRKQINISTKIRWSDEEVLETLGDKRFFAEMYFSKKQPTQKISPFSIVLFMPENDLQSYVDELRKLSYALDLPKDQARKQLQYLLTELAERFAAASLKEVNNMEVEDIMDLMLGIEREGFAIEKNMSYTQYKLKDLGNKKKFPDEAVIELGDAITNSTRKLEGIIKSKPPYKFKYSTDENNTYYWIPVEFMY